MSASKFDGHRLGPHRFFLFYNSAVGVGALFLALPFPTCTFSQMADSDDVKQANDDLSRLLRSSVFPGGVYPFPKRSVTHEMLGQAQPQNPEYK